MAAGLVGRGAKSLTPRRVYDLSSRRPSPSPNGKGEPRRNRDDSRADKGDMTDEDLVRRFRSGEERCFDDLVRRHQERVYWIARRIVGSHDDADDVVQDVFIKVYRKLEGFRGESSFSTWLHRIAVNTAIGMQRRKKIIHWLRLDELPEASLGGTSPKGTPSGKYRPEMAGMRTVSSGHPASVGTSDVPHSQSLDSLEVEEQRQLIEDAIERLPAKQRQVFVLRFYDELPYAEISKILKKSVGGLKANYHHAVKKIAAYVRQNI